MTQGHVHRLEPRHRAIVPAPRVVLSPEPVPVGSPRHVPGSEPQVELIKDGEIIQAIEITCTCGKRIRLRCVYP